MAKTRPEEQFASEIMRRTLGINVTDHDDNSQPAMVDGHFTLNGSPGAVEVTTAVDQEWMQAEAIIGETELEIAGLQWSWHVMVGTGIRLADLRHHIEVLLPACEQQRLVRPDYLHPHPDLTDSYTWYFTHDIDAAAVPESRHPGKIYLVPAIGGGGAVPDNLDGFPAWLAEDQVKEPDPVLDGDRRMGPNRRVRLMYRSPFCRPARPAQNAQRRTTAQFASASAPERRIRAGGDDRHGGERDRCTTLTVSSHDGRRTGRPQRRIRSLTARHRTGRHGEPRAVP